jgi:hypothetical protein
MVVMAAGVCVRVVIVAAAVVVMVVGVRVIMRSGHTPEGIKAWASRRGPC